MLSAAPLQIKRKPDLAAIQGSVLCWDVFTIPSLMSAGPASETPTSILTVTQVRTAPVTCSYPLSSFLQLLAVFVLSPIQVTAVLNADVNWS